MTPPEQEKDQKKQRQDRVSQLFNNTWEMEILLFGFVLVYIWPLPEKLKSFGSYLNLILDNQYLETVIASLLVVTLIGVIILIVSMIIHLFLRGFWIAIIGLNSAFPEGIKRDKLPGSDQILGLLKRKLPDLNDFEQKLENICSGTFAFAILIVLSWISVGIIMAISVTIILLIDNLTIDSDLYILLGLLLVVFFIVIPAMLYAIDFLTLGMLKSVKKKWFTKPYYYVYRIFSIITLSVLARPIYYTFVTNLSGYKTKFLISLIPLATFILVLNFPVYTSQLYFPNEQTSQNKTVFKKKYVDFLKDVELIEKPVIPKQAINKDFLQVFIPYNAEKINALLENNFGNIPKLRTGGWQSSGFVNVSTNQDSVANTKDQFNNKAEKVLKCLDSLYTFRIGGNRVKNDAMSFYIHPRNDLPGFITYLPIDQLKPGKHVLEINDTRDQLRIPFYYHPG